MRTVSWLLLMSSVLWPLHYESDAHVPPTQGGTILGPPDKIEDLGETEVPEDLLYEYLVDLGPQFT